MQFSVCVSGDDAGDYPLVNRQEESRYRADKKCADDGACPENAARQDVERVCSQVCKQEQRDAKMRDAQPDKKDDDSDKDFPETALHMSSSISLILWFVTTVLHY